MACYLYIIAMGEAGPVKIGVSGNLKARISKLQTGNPRKLHLAHCFEFPSKTAARKAERASHQFWSDLEMQGEWFNLDVRCAIAGTTAAIE